MAVSNLVVKQDYICNGAQDTFPIPFSFIKVEQLRAFLIDPTTGVETAWTMGGEYTLDPPYDPLLPLDYLNIIATTPPASGSILRLIRVTALVQDADYENSGQLLLEELEKSFDKLVYMAQELDQRLDNVPMLAPIDQGQIDPTLTKAAANQVLAISADGLKVYWADLAAIQAEAGSGLPIGGDLGYILEKTGPGPIDAVWKDTNYIGYSQRYGQLVNLVGAKATLDFIMNMGYSPPSVSFTASGSGTIREKGNAVTAVDLDLSFTKVSEDVEEVRFYYDGGLVHTDNTLNPAADSVSYNWTGSFADNKTFQAQVDDATNAPAVTINRTFSFVYPYYFGVGAAGLGAGVSALTKDIINSNANLTKSFSPNGSQKLYFAYPASYGALTAIYDVNNFNTLPDWTLTTTNITGLDGNPVSYRIYEFNNFAVAGTYSYNFVR